MSSLTIGELDRIRDQARRIEERATTHEADLEILVAATETNLRHVRANLSDVPEGTKACIDHFATALWAQLRRSEETLSAARQLCVAARADRLSAGRLSSSLCDNDDEHPWRGYAPRHAVLVVDDYEDTREFLSAVLHDAGFIVRTASNGLEAVIAAYEMRPTVIVMDFTMPVLDGVEATRLIKTIDALRDARVIGYTAQPTLHDSVVAKLFAAVLEKPASPDVVVAMVQQYAVA